MTASSHKRLSRIAFPMFLALGLAWSFGAFPFGRNTRSPESESQAVAVSSREEPERIEASTVHSGVGVVHITASDFDDRVLKSDVPVLVDFYADWCGPCRLQAPILDALAREIDTGKIVKVNVDDSHELVSRFQIGSIPAVLIFKNGQKVGRYTGVASKKQLKAMLDKA